MNTSTSNPSAAFLGQLNNTVDAYQGNPQALGAKVQSTSNKPVVQQGLVNLIALEMINNDLKAAENQVRMSLDPSQQTIAQQKENEVMGRYEADIARRVAAVDANKRANQQKMMQRIVGSGLPTARPNVVPNRKPNTGGLVNEFRRVSNQKATAAHGGLVSFANGTGDATVGDAAAEQEPENLRDWLLQQSEETIGDVVGLMTEKPIEAAALGLFAYDVYNMIKARFGSKDPKAAASLARLGTMFAQGTLKLPGRARNAVGKVKQLFGKGKTDESGQLSLPGMGQGGSRGRTAAELAEGAGNLAGKTISKLKWPAYAYLGSGMLPAPGTSEEKVGEVEEVDDNTLIDNLSNQDSTGTPPLGINEQMFNLLEKELGQFDAQKGAMLDQQGQIRSRISGLEESARTDAERERVAGETLQNIITDSQNARRTGIDSFKRAQETAYGDRQEIIDQLNNMAKDATGGKLAALRDLQVGLSAIGQGDTLGQGAGIAGSLIAERVEGREDKARGIQKEALGEKLRLSEDRLTGAQDVLNLENEFQNAAVNAIQLTNSNNREARQAAQTTQQILFNVEKLLSDTSINIAQLEKERIASLATAVTNQAQLMVAQGQIGNYEATQLIEILKIMNDRLETTILSGGDQEEISDLKKQIQTLYEKFIGLVPTN